MRSAHDLDEVLDSWELDFDPNAGISVDPPIIPYPQCAHWLTQYQDAFFVALADGSVWLHRPVASSTLPRAERLHVFRKQGPDGRPVPDACTCLSSTDQDRWLAGCSEGTGDAGTVVLWRATGRPPSDHSVSEAYQKVSTFRVPEYTWHIALFSQRSRPPLIATAGSQREVALWDASGRSVGQLIGHQDAIRACCVLDDPHLPEARLLVTASEDRTVLLWDVLNQEELAVLHVGTTTPYVATSNGRVLIADGNRLILHDLRDLERYLRQPPTVAAR